MYLISGWLLKLGLGLIFRDHSAAASNWNVHLLRDNIDRRRKFKFYGNNDKMPVYYLLPTDFLRELEIKYRVM